MVNRLAELTVPVLLIAGEQDVPDIVGAARFMAERLPMVHLKMIQEAAHLPNMECPDQFDGLLEDWLLTTGAEKPSRPGHKRFIMGWVAILLFARRELCAAVSLREQRAGRRPEGDDGERKKRMFKTGHEHVCPVRGGAFAAEFSTLFGQPLYVWDG